MISKGIGAACKCFGSCIILIYKLYAYFIFVVKFSGYKAAQ